MGYSFIKDPDKAEDFVIDWSEYLGSDTIATSTWTVPSGITKQSSSFTTTKVTIWLSGGTDGAYYELVDTITTAAGVTADIHVSVYVKSGAVAGESPYNLRVQGIADIARYTSLLQQRRVTRESMSGLVDGSNKTFRTQLFPVLATGGFNVFTSGSVISVDFTDTDTGTVVLTTAPTVQPEASYTYTPFTTEQQLSLLVAGFDEMQLRWVRSDWHLSSSGSTVVPADESSTAIYIVQDSTTSGSAIDPPCSGSVPFSMCRTQIRFYMACCEYAYLARQLTETALTGVSYRERAGAQLDRSRIPQNIKLALDQCEKALIRALKAAWDEYYTGGEQYGEAILPPHSVGYTALFDWHDNVYPSTAEEWNWL
jgi:hypothetical protein